MEEGFTAWIITHCLNIGITLGILIYCLMRYRKQSSGFNLALLVEPGFHLLSLVIKLVHYTTPTNADYCGYQGQFTCFNMAYHIMFLIQLGNLR